MQIQPVLLAGGSGTRLAPLSSATRPKPFIPFQDGTSLYQHTLQRVQAPSYASPIVIGHVSQRFALLNHARDVGVQPTILLETTATGTALAIALAAKYALQTQSQRCVLAIMPCDHWLENASHWRSCAAALAARVSAHAAPCLGLMGIAARSPEPGLGYIAADTEGRVRQFTEKPADPAALLTHGDWYYNSGQFFARAGDMRALFLAHAPHVWREAERLHGQMLREHEFLLAPPANLAEPVSFDHAVVQSAARHCLLEPLTCGWADLGTREAWCAHTEIAWETQCAAPERVDRPWGYFYVRGETDQQLVKHLHVYPGKRLSLQRHTQRTEHWRVLSGSAQVTLEGTTTTLHAGETVLIGRDWWHRLENTTRAMLVIEETQEGLPNEADIERAEDDFGRVSAAGR